MAFESEETDPPGRLSVRSKCPECDGDLAVLRVISGRAGCEYWTMRCSGCGGIYLDILEPDASIDDNDGRSAAR